MVDTEVASLIDVGRVPVVLEREGPRAHDQHQRADQHQARARSARRWRPRGTPAAITSGQNDPGGMWMPCGSGAAGAAAQACGPWLSPCFSRQKVSRP